MSKDIRSYFMVGGSKAAKPSNTSSTLVPNRPQYVSKKRKQNIILDSSESSGDDFEDLESTKKTKVTNNASTCSLDQKKSEKKKPDLKPVANVADILGVKPAKRSLLATLPEKEPPSKKVKEHVKKKPHIEVEVHSDEEFEATLEQLDALEKQGLASVKKEKSPPPKTNGNKYERPTTSTNPESKKSPSKATKSKYFDTTATDKILPDFRALKASTKNGEILKETTPNKPSRPQNDSTSSNKHHTPTSSSKTPQVDDLTPEALEKRKQHAEQYRKYIQRSGPAHLHSKEIPEGVPHCLQGLTFVMTGVLDSIDREEAAELIKGYGGKVTSSVSKNTSYMLVGTEPGPSKMEKASKLGTPVVDEDGLFELIKTRQPFSATPSPTATKTKNKTREKSSRKETDTHKESHNSKIANEKKTDSETKIKTEKDIETKIKTEKDIETKIKTEKDIVPKSDSPVSLKNTKKTNLSTQSSSNVSNSSENSQSPGASTSAFQATPSPEIKREGKDLTESNMWVDKYKPQNVKQIIGQQGDRSPANKLKVWLENWMKNNAPGTAKKNKPAPWDRIDDGAAFKAALLSGPPGIGKTTTAQLLCKELGFDIVEFNASDTRSKKLLQEEVREQMSCKTLVGFLSSKENKALSDKRVLLMEEVDGVAGNQDRGGISELISLIKQSRIPVICTCNDRNSQKLRSLAGHCFDLRFPKPRLEQIRGAMMSLCFKEKVKIPAEALNSIIEGTNHDIRQVIHHLSLWCAGQQNMDQDLAKREAHKSRKEIKLGPWDVVRKVFTEQEQRGKSLNEKASLFFHDYSMGPLFVQENYIFAVPHAPPSAEGVPRKSISQREVLRRIADASDCIAKGDLVENCIRGNSSWGLLPVQAIFSSVAPGEILSGHLSKINNFPTWFGKNSRTNKFSRLISELQMHMRLSISGSKEAVALDYLTPVRDKIIRRIENNPDAALKTMQKYNLLREDLDSMNELCNWGTGQVDPWSKLPTQVKTAFTKAYNKANIMTPYTIAGTGVKGGRRRGGGDNEDMDEFAEREEGETVEEEEEEDDDPAADSMIKAKKARGGNKGAGNSKGAGSSKGGRGRGKK